MAIEKKYCLKIIVTVFIFKLKEVRKKGMSAIGQGML